MPPPGKQAWRASQTLKLKSGDGATLLTLVGTLKATAWRPRNSAGGVADATAERAPRR